MASPENTALNPLCTKCLRPCKQSATVVLVECPRFLPLPFKVERHRFDQLELFKDISG
jgi:hypothetical protein